MADYLDPNTYHKAKNKTPSRVVSIAKIDADLYDITLSERDNTEAGDGALVNNVYRVSLGVVQDIHQKTTQERNRLNNLITDLQAVV